MARRTSAHRVVSPPSARMTTSAATPEGLGERGVLELDAEPALAQRDAEREVEQQAGQAEPVGQPEGDRGDEDDEGADGERDGDRGVHRRAPMGAVSRTPESGRHRGVGSAGVPAAATRSPARARNSTAASS